MYASHVLTPYGNVIVYATDSGVTGVSIPDMSRQAVHHSGVFTMPTSDITIRTAGLLQSYFNGEPVDFRDIPVVLDGMPSFRQKVLQAIRCLGHGDICSYGYVAALCNSPHAARAIGGALAANPVPIIIPCHRVVASSGRLTGFSAPGGLGTKMALLKLEHIEFKGMLVVKNQLVMHSVSSK